MNKMDSQLTGMWVNFFTAAGIPSDVGATYALTFSENRIQSDMLLDLNKEYLRDMGISRMGDVIAILRHAKTVHETAARDRVLTSTSSRVPVAAVAARSNIVQGKPASPASRILEHYTRNSSPTEMSQLGSSAPLKRRSGDFNENGDMKKARLIRFNSPPKSLNDDAPSGKNRVFARLGNTESMATSSNKQSSKVIYSRLGSKPNTNPVLVPELPVPKGALKYEGILKSPPQLKNTFTVTSDSKTRKIAVTRTMRADEVPLTIKEKLTLPKPKLVKFSNTVQYKEFETQQSKVVVAKPLAKVTQVFNKPERRLIHQPPPAGLKSRLGLKQAANNAAITRSVFNRLGQ